MTGQHSVSELASNDPTSFAAVPEMPTSIIRVTITSRTANTTRMEIKTTFSSPAAIEQLLTMGMDEGMAAAVGQIPEILQATSGGGR